MSLFGAGSDEDREAAEARLARLESLPAPELAGEVAAAAWGAGAEPARRISQAHLADELLARGTTFEQRERLEQLLAEGFAALLAGGLAAFHFSGGDIASLEWALSRRGRELLESGSIEEALTHAA